jgi:hypothetical protein
MTKLQKLVVLFFYHLSMKRKTLIVSVLAIFCINSCIQLEQICADSVETPLSLNFKKRLVLKNRNNQDSIIIRDTFLYIKQILVEGSDSVFYQSTKPSDSLRQINVRYNPIKDSVGYVFSYDKGNTARTDLLRLRYARKIELTSPECGVKTNYSNLTLRTTFDSLAFRSTKQNISVDVYFQ